MSVLKSITLEKFFRLFHFAKDSENRVMTNQPSKAYENIDFLNEHEARPIRVLCELMEPDTRLEQQGIENTIVFFGSARPKPLAEAKKALDDLLTLTQMSKLVKIQKRIYKRPVESLNCLSITTKRFNSLKRLRNGAKMPKGKNTIFAPVAVRV